MDTTFTLIKLNDRLSLTYGFDGFSGIFLAVVAVLHLAVFVYSLAYMKEKEHKPSYYAALAVAGFAMVMMAFSSGAPIWPVYMKPRKNKFSRLRVAIGEPIDVKSMLGKMPTMERINEVTEYITEKENYLKSICK